MHVWYTKKMILPQSFVLPFLHKVQVAKDTYSFFFDRTKHDFSFIPGHYIRITLPHENQDDRGSTRLFSLVTSPNNTKELAITTRVLQSSFKHALANLIPGTEVQFFGPMGRFLLDETISSPLVFLAGGIGLTPFHAMLTYANEKNLQNNITFIVSFSTVEEVAYKEEFEQIAQRHPNIKIIYTVTQSSTSSWQGETGRISAEMIKKYVQNVLQPLYYIVGPPKMAEAMEGIVKEMGVPMEQIKKEQFVGY